MHLIREFEPDAYEFALSSWSWIGTADKTPRFASCFGDIFLEGADGWWFLDTVEGTLDRQWDDIDSMFAELEDADGRAEYLLEETLTAALGQGMRLADDEVFAFLPPPAVTGSMAVDSLAPLRFAIAANLAGRIHGELHGVQPDPGVSAMFAAQRLAEQQAAAAKYAAQEAAARQAATRAAAAANGTRNPQADRWQSPAQHVNTGAYPAYEPSAAHERPADAAHTPVYAAGSELDYRAQPVGSGYSPGHTAGYGYGSSDPYGGPADAAHTVDSGQFSQYIADQYNTGQIASVGYYSPAQARGAGWPV